MSNSKSTDTSEDERIQAWRAERARIAEADKAQRIQQKQAEMAQSANTAKQDQKSAALTLLSSVPPTPPPQLEAETAPVRKSIPFSKLGNWPLFCAIVVAPFLIVAFYLLAVATPLYEARSVIAITKSAESGNAQRSGLLGGVQGSSNLSEVFRAHSYVQSQALMDALETELGLITEFSGPAIDPLKRLRTVPVLSLSKSSQFSRYVETSVDIQSGLLTLFVRAPNDAQAIVVSEAVLRNTQEQVLALGQQVFDQRQEHATNVRLAAEKQVAEAQAALIALQIKYQEVDPRNRVEGIYTTIKDLEAEATRLNSEVQKAQISGIGDSQQTQQTVALEARIRQQIAEQRARLVAPDGASAGSLNTLLMEYELATLELSLAREAAQTALKSQAAAGQEAALNRSLFQVVVPPRTAQIAVYPRIPGTLALVLIISLAIFSGFTMFRSART
jgi:capsule polysaccharide export protein KpsE/RkpR